MACISMVGEALGGAFVTALLLTGSAEGAEAAILEGIRVMEGSNGGEDLLHTTLAASVATNAAGRGVEEQEYAASLLPAELRRVLRLSQDIRRCFVLRVLVGLSREACAKMLKTEIHHIDELVCVSTRALAWPLEENRFRQECAAAMSSAA